MNYISTILGLTMKVLCEHFVHDTFVWWGMVSISPNTQDGGPPLVVFMFLATLHIRGRSSIRNLRTRHAVVQDTDKVLARPVKKQDNVSVRMAWISFGTLPCKKKKTWWQLASRCCWNRARPWHASELVSFLIGLRTYQHPGKRDLLIKHKFIQQTHKGSI